MTSLVWMRRDLRLHDHAALATALAEQGDIQPVFVFDTDILARFNRKDDRRLIFLAETLCNIQKTLHARGGNLLVLHGRAEEIIPQLAHALGAQSVFSAEDFEPATRARDAAVKAALSKHHIRFVQVLDHLLVAPQSMLKSDRTPYKVFTPWYKLWRSCVGENEVAEYKVTDLNRYADFARIKQALAPAALKPLPLAHPEQLLQAIGYEYKKDPLWTVDDAQQRLKQFVSKRMADYPKARDELDKSGTSELSPYLRHGLVSVRECTRAALAHGQGEKWISELGWREFYAGILFHFPDVVEHEFQPQYRGLPWSYDQKLIDAFTTGKTGFPVVDAAVRELLNTGYMHNRARMIVASFLTKDLHLDWRIGEEFFAQYLMDYELASNNGGWQWAASTGTDAQPYFRVFNPLLQSKKFDPNGDYIRQHVPELRRLKGKEIHDPHAFPLTAPKDYPLSVVDHAEAKARAIAMFKGLGRDLP